MKTPRMTLWLVISIVLAIVIYMTMPLDPQPSRWARFLMLVNKINLVTLAGWIAYWFDRTAFYYGRPDQIYARAQHLELSQERAAVGAYIAYGCAMLRRAVIVGSAMLAVGLGA